MPVMAQVSGAPRVEVMQHAEAHVVGRPPGVAPHVSWFAATVGMATHGGSTCTVGAWHIPTLHA